MGAQELLLQLGLHENFITAPGNNRHGLLDLGGQAGRGGNVRRALGTW